MHASARRQAGLAPARGEVVMSGGSMSSGPKADRVVVLATLDTKSDEAQFVVAELRRRGAAPWLIDTSTAGMAKLQADSTPADVAAAVGMSVGELRSQPKSAAMSAVAMGASTLIAEMVGGGLVAGVLGIGGGQGTWLAVSAMRELPYGLPKLMVTTIAARFGEYVGAADIVMVPTITDIAGLNRLLVPTLSDAAAALWAMIESRQSQAATTDPLVAMTMFGVTTPGGTAIRQLLEQAGPEVAVFHANGRGGVTLESLIRAGKVQAVLDLTITELADELVGGIATAGPHRLEAAGELGLPQLIAPGALDVVNFGRPETVPSRFAGRVFHQHTPGATLMRTNEAESKQLGAIVADKLSQAKGPTAVIIPARGFSALDAIGQPFYDPAADAAFVDELQRKSPASISITVVDAHINDVAFAEAVVQNFSAMIDDARNESAAGSIRPPATRR
jgi:uncharacterized protein (UPF0261 family)